MANPLDVFDEFADFAGIVTLTRSLHRSDANRVVYELEIAVGGKELSANDYTLEKAIRDLYRQASARMKEIARERAAVHAFAEKHGVPVVFDIIEERTRDEMDPVVHQTWARMSIGERCVYQTFFDADKDSMVRALEPALFAKLVESGASL